MNTPFSQEIAQSKTTLGEMFEESILSFGEELLELSMRLDMLTSQDDLDGCKKVLHTIKGSCAQLGFKSLSSKVHKIEDLLVSDALEKGWDWSVSLNDFSLLLNDFATKISTKGQIEASDDLYSDLLKELNPDLLAKGSGVSQKSFVIGNELKLKEEDYNIILGTLSRNITFAKGQKITDLMKDNESALFALYQSRFTSGRGLASRLVKLVRDTSTATGKTVKFEISGFEQSIERNLLQSLSEILTHMIRNAIDHGIEEVQSRVNSGKGESGEITLKLSIENEVVEVILQDDGQGIDGEKIAQKAYKNGHLTQEKLESMTFYEKQQLIFSSGFSTRETVSDTSGRGVGMGAVLEEINKNMGLIVIDSEIGTGSRFSMVFPPKYQFQQFTLIRNGERLYALPQYFIEEIVNSEDIVEILSDSIVLNNDTEIVTLRLREIEKNQPSQKSRIIILKLVGMEVAIFVDEYLSTEKILIQAYHTQDEPAYIMGIGENKSLEKVYYIDCHVIEKDLNHYLNAEGESIEAKNSDDTEAFQDGFVYWDEEDENSQKTNAMQEDEHKQLIEHKENNMQFKNLNGPPIKTEQVIAALTSEKIVAMMNQTLSDCSEEDRIFLEDQAFKEVEQIIDTIKEVHDADEMQYMLAVRYAHVKSAWIMLNIKIQYQLESGTEPHHRMTHWAALLTLILQHLEPIINPSAIDTISGALAEPFDKVA